MAIEDSEETKAAVEGRHGLVAGLRRWLRGRSERLDLMSEMFKRTDAMDALLRSVHNEQHLRSAMHTCLGCRHAADCRAWLAESRDTVPPAFCPNAPRIRQFGMSRQVVGTTP